MSDASPKELLVFEVNGHNFAVPLSVVEEVVPASVITAIPKSPPFLLGLAAVRGKVMAVIDASRRYGLGNSLASFFLVCHVRGNVTAVAINRAVLAGTLLLRDLDEAELELARSACGIDAKFLRGGHEVLELVGDTGATQSTGVRCLNVDPDLFVSAEMASRIGEAA